MNTLRENSLSIIIIIFAIALGFFLQHFYHLPLIAGAFIGVLLGVLGGFIIQLIKSKQNKSTDKNDNPPN
ncbi:hypothetical protein [Staphylococcus chromogenes]|uniref:hypothetical protein n=1 Tax=Staphylococcus chromogenes TaxID=46126 RepID=UPI000D198AEF|nr:hypothetical protein [Staphylococcus chromogenes]MCE4965695.1 hypothetical protein [Staphylococcus chromogenes]MDU0450749.1 hypothetical protein [Staphylococcus chromogenes]PTF68412.1 hypothetical protein BUY03_09905 [Staphylococcus chromogenes]PTF68531.1 hypothetical protein BUY01_08300 [Staphylococcus chromogenes]PTF74644.1 hypothetical protein BUX97_08875 [Staphylococcus chromogenes]